jgi:hypothetical protein
MVSMLNELENDYPKYIKIIWGGVSRVKI